MSPHPETVTVSMLELIDLLDQMTEASELVEAGLMACSDIADRRQRASLSRVLSVAVDCLKTGERRVERFSQPTAE